MESLTEEEMNWMMRALGVEIPQLTSPITDHHILGPLPPGEHYSASSKLSKRAKRRARGRVRR